MHRDPALHTAHYALRFELTWNLVETGRVMTVAELAARAEARGWDLGERPGAKVSQTLRGEVRKGRVVREARNQYRLGVIPKSTRSRIGSTVHHNRGVLQAARLVALGIVAPEAADAASCQESPGVIGST